MVQAEETNPPTTGSANPSVGGQTSNHELTPDGDSRNVFVVHGRNLAIRDQLFTFLRALDLHPLEWSEAVRMTERPSPYIGDILDAAFSRAQAVVVLLSPDDLVRLRQELWTDDEAPAETELSGQARPNVLFEAGMAMGRFPNRTVLVEVGALKPFSDISGIHVIRLNDTTQRRQEFAHRLLSAGCPINLNGTDWHSAGNFAIDLPQLEPNPTDEHGASVRSGFVQTLSEEAIELLIAAASGAAGGIILVRYLNGLGIIAGNLRRDARGNPRAGALLEGALRDLVEAEFVVEDTESSGEFFRVTREGFEFVDTLTASTPED